MRGVIKQKFKIAIVTVVIPLWILLVGYGFWTIHFRYLGSISPNGSMEAAEGKLNIFIDHLVSYLEPGRRKGNIYLIHFFDPDCPCSRYVQTTIAKLSEKNYLTDKSEPNTLIQVMISPEPLRENLKENAFQNMDSFYTYSEIVGSWENGSEDPIPAYPMVVIAGGDSSVYYMGPYGSASMCTDQNKSYPQMVLDLLRENGDYHLANLGERGCFCRHEKDV